MTVQRKLAGTSVVTSVQGAGNVQRVLPSAVSWHTSCG